MTANLTLTGAQLFDGEALHDGLAVEIAAGRITRLLPRAEAPSDAIRLSGGILAPGFLDLQVNGGGGIMLDGAVDAARLARICDAHASLGATSILPTLITDRREATRAVIASAIRAAQDGLPGFAGLHLEGPHLDPRRHGAHDPALIREMEAEDLAALCEAAQALPALIVTLAPATTRPDQIATLTAAGAIVSLGHSDCSYDEAMTAIRAGASMATHLFNAMSPLTSRAPGLVGAVLDSDIDCGVIADGIHVHPATLRSALAAKRAGRAFLVSDAMAVAGTDQRDFALAGRQILRREGRLTLADGTLAGADLDLPRAAGLAVSELHLPFAQALAMASRIPADIIAAPDRGRIAPGARADLLHLDEGLTLRRIWRDGREIVPATP